MAEFAILKDGVVERFRNFDGDPPDVATHKGYSILPVVRETIDNSTQRFKDKVTTEIVEPTRLLIQTVYTDKPQQEIDQLRDEESTAVVNLFDDDLSLVRALGLTLLDVANQVRELQGKQPLTVQQFKSYVKAKL